ncbi:MAG TPA: type I polyketide synthase [Ktedonosporobacter sp.]|jgi:enediyne polyketide synthase|nr:type I polyketide synthase [Ktedonosporobacter sp.]
MTDIAIVGMSCCYPDARSPQELWENVLAQRQAFRRFPAERLRIEDYFCQDVNTPDTTYASQGAFIQNYEFDRVRFRISGSAYRSSDLAHWLALDIASQALADAGFSTPESLPATTTRVVVGNTLTGEFSRANSLRLRWPYVHRVVEATLCQEGWSVEQRQPFLRRLEALYKAPFAPIGEETLAGGLSNTIAGRICNYFNLKGGGYTVDGACASSLLAIATACSALAAGEADLALAGGVDLSLDPFEIVGFAKTAALAAEEMRVYDLRSNGFIPGEGCGFVALMRYEDALAQQRRVYALVRGWGISSDGSGGITRPEAEGQLLALKRAYHKAGIGIDSVEYFEGHGTGTSVGDLTELQTVSRARRQASASVPPAIIGSIKANIGHTKAAAGVAGFIKATMALSTQIVPPMTGTGQLHPELAHEQAALMIRSTGAIWTNDRPLRAGVSAMGFGGINTHLVLEGISSRRRTSFTKQEHTLLASAQDVELILLSGQNIADMHQQVAHLLSFAARLSKAEITDLALHLLRTLTPGPVRAAIVAASPAELTRRLERLQTLLDGKDQIVLDSHGGVFFGRGDTPPRVGFLFPGQGSPSYLREGLLRRRFDFVHDLYRKANLATGGDEKDTAIAQPAIVTASLASLRILEKLGITAEVGLGHSLGELTALHWGGAFDEDALLQLATVRGQVMGSLGSPTGSMASLLAPREFVDSLIEGEPIVIAGLNSPRQVVISGDMATVTSIVERARANQIRAVVLKVSHAFHSPLVAAAVPPLEQYLENVAFQPLQRSVISTVTGSQVDPERDLKALLCEQITAPVLFMDALKAAAARVDLFIEVGPGKVLSGLAGECASIPAFSLDADGPSIKGLVQVVGAAFAAGIPLQTSLLAENRFSRPFDLDWRPRFFANPCEQAPLPGTEVSFSRLEELDSQGQLAVLEDEALPAQTEEIATIDLVRRFVAEATELPEQAISDHHRMLSDLHLNSIRVGQIVSEAARALGLIPPAALTEYADATLAEIAQALTELKQTGGTQELEECMRTPAGIDSWIRAFEVSYIEKACPLDLVLLPQQPHSNWKVLAPPQHPYAEDLRKACAHLQGEGVIVCLPPQPGQEQIPLLLQGVQEVLRSEEPVCFALVQHGGGGAGVARTLALEAPRHTVCVVDVPVAHPRTVEWVMTEIQAARGYSETMYDVEGKRRVPILQLFPLRVENSYPLSLGPADVLLVTGGGKGIAAECALSLALETGVRLVLLGRSRPYKDNELAENLRRFAAAEITFRYISADVTNLADVERAISEAEHTLGPITAILHGAGTNTPKLLSELTEAEFLQTIGPKVEGLKLILANIDQEKLRLLVTFGSVIARTGMRGEADYALSNDWLGALTERFQLEHPACRCLCLEWSVWAGVGMGERLGRIEALIREGIMPIAIDKGIASFRTLLNHRLPGARVIVTNRFGMTPTLQMSIPDLPFLRFLEQPRVHYPGIELIADVELSVATDPYLEDHRFRGERLLPAVTGLEAMAQIAMGVTGNKQLPCFEQVQLTRPIVVPERGSLKIRLATLITESGKVDVVVRSEETGFQVDHFRATCRFGTQPFEQCEQVEGLPVLVAGQSQRIPLDPASDLYGTLLFHKGRFQRVRGYLHLRATECIAEITPFTEESFFAHYLPSELVLGDFAARDAVIHCIQACIPQGQLLPVAIEEVRFISCLHEMGQPYFVYAKERSRVGDLFTYDVEVRTAQGQVREQWRGLQLRQVEVIQPQTTWNETLLGPYMERKLNDFLSETTFSLIIQRYSDQERQGRSDQAFQCLLGSNQQVQRRLDGRPALMERLSPTLSASHHTHFTLAVASQRVVGCDIEAIANRPPLLWQDLLGTERWQLASFLTSQASEDLDTAATRLWAAGECLKKAGAMVNVPLRFGARKGDGWILLKAGSFLISTYIAQVQGEKSRLVFAICSEVKDSAEMERAIRR